MKPGVLGLLAVSIFAAGCGPGFSHRVKAPAPEPDVFVVMDAELENAISTTALTSETMPLPGSRLSVAQWEEDQDAVTAPVTWGAHEPATADAPTKASAQANASDPASYP